MHESLPVAEQLSRLPLRGLVAYAARNARRAAFEYEGGRSNEIAESVLEPIDRMWQTDFIPDLNSDVIPLIQRIFPTGQANIDWSDRVRVVTLLLPLFNAVFTMFWAIRVVGSPTHIRSRLRAARAAEKTAHVARTLESEGRGAAADAARRDYSMLVDVLGEGEELRIGEPINFL